MLVAKRVKMTDYLMQKSGPEVGMWVALPHCLSHQVWVFVLFCFIFLKMLSCFTTKIRDVSLTFHLSYVFMQRSDQHRKTVG